MKSTDKKKILAVGEKEKRSTETKRVLIYGWIDFALFWLILLFVGLLLYTFFAKHMVTTPWPSELSPSDLKNGDGAVLAAYWSFGILLVIAIFARLTFSILICHALVTHHKHYQKTSNGKVLVLLRKIGYFIGIFFGVLIPLVLPLYYVKKGYFAGTTQPRLQSIKRYRNFWLTSFRWIGCSLMVIAPNAALGGLIIGTAFLVNTKPYYNAENCRRFYQLSSNHNNILYLYYDRTDSWRVREGINHLDADSKKAFSDFTFYENNLSISDTTVSSVPYMSFGYNPNIFDKLKIAVPIHEITVPSLDGSNTNVTFPGSHDEKFRDLSIREYYKYSLANFVAFWNYLGYGITNIGNYVYYGSQSPFLRSPNNSEQMNNEMRNEFGFKNFSGVNSNELQIYNQRKVHGDNVDDAYTTGNLSKTINFVPTNTGVFTAFYSQQNHWDFAIKSGSGYRKLYGNNPKNLHHAIHDSLVDLSGFLKWFKNNYPDIYKHTTIVINSDHGHCFENHPEELSSFKKAAGFAPVFMVKPMNAEPISNDDEPFHVDSRLISTADQLAFIRELIYPKWNEKPTSDPWDPKTRFSQLDQSLSNFSSYRANFNKGDLWNRSFKVMRPHDWRFLYWRHEIEATRTRVFHCKNTQSVFDENNWTDLK